MGEAKWYLSMGMIQKEKYITLDQDQYVMNITTRSDITHAVNKLAKFLHTIQG